MAEPGAIARTVLTELAARGAGPVAVERAHNQSVA